MTKQHKLVARSPGGPQTKTGQGARLNTDKLNLKKKLGTKDSLKPLCKVTYKSFNVCVTIAEIYHAIQEEIDVIFGFTKFQFFICLDT
jgi:hypothetical protein